MARFYASCQLTFTFLLSFSYYPPQLLGAVIPCAFFQAIYPCMQNILCCSFLQPPYLFFITLLYQKNKAMSSGFSIKFLFMEQRIFLIPCPTFITYLQNIQHPLQQFCQEFHSLLPLLPVAELYWLTGLYQKLNCKCLLSV